ncbi:MAG TPA: hypothetical protein VGG57_02715 [Stellaceae bacterium]
MHTLFRTWLTASAMTAALAAPAVAQGAPGFDGSYAGVSRKLVSDTSAHHICPPSGGIGVLTIRGGVAQTRWGSGTYDGQVTAQGTLTMRASNGAHFDGHISGNVAQGQSLNGPCTQELTWQKQ